MSVRAMTLAAWGFTCCIPAGAQLHNVLSAQEKTEGFELLFDGTRENFKRNFVTYFKNDSTTAELPPEWQVIDSLSAIGTLKTTNDLRSIRIFKDFDLRMDYRCTGEAGVYYRARQTHDVAWQTGLHYFIENVQLDGKESAGALYSVYAPFPQTYQPYNTGKWNELRIVAKGDSIEHWMNGVKVLGFKLHSDGFWAAYLRSKWNASGTMSFNVPKDKSAGFITEGNIGFQADHSGRWEIRNLRIREIMNPASIAITPGRHPIPSLPSVGRGGFSFSWGDGSQAGADGRISAPK